MNITIKTFRVIIDSSKCSISSKQLYFWWSREHDKPKDLNKCAFKISDLKGYCFIQETWLKHLGWILRLIWDSIMRHKQFRRSFLALITANELLCRGAHDSNSTMHLLIGAFYFCNTPRSNQAKLIMPIVMPVHLVLKGK